MTYSPGYAGIAPTMVSPYTLGWSMFPNEAVYASYPASGAFEAADRAAYVPVLVSAICIVRRLWWANGSTVSASYNIDCGVYADAGYKPGAKLISTGSTAQGTASQVQFVDVTDTVLSPGRYWLALACSSASATFFRGSASASIDAAWRFEQASAFALPATATPVESNVAYLYLCGFATTASP